MALKPVIRDRQIERHGDSIRNVTIFLPSRRMEEFTSGMIDVAGRNVSSPVHSRLIKFMQHYAVVMCLGPVLVGIPIPCRLPTSYDTDISSLCHYM